MNLTQKGKMWLNSVEKFFRVLVDDLSSSVILFFSLLICIPAPLFQVFFMYGGNNTEYALKSTCMFVYFMAME